MGIILKYIFINLITTIFYESIKSQCITGVDATQVSDCTQNNDINNYCCFIQNIMNQQNICYAYPKSQFNGQVSTQFQGITYDMNCDNNSTNTAAGGICNANPSTQDDCFGVTSPNHQCCFFQVSVLKTCYWIMKTEANNGTNYIGPTLLTCSSSQIELYLYIYLLTLFIIFL